MKNFTKIVNKLRKKEKKRDWWKIKIRTRTKKRLKVTEDTMWLNWSDWTSHLSDNPISADVLSVPGSGSPFSALRSTFPVPCLPLCHCCLIMLLVNFHTQLRLTTSKAVSNLERKTCQVAEHNNRCEEGKIIIFLRRVEVVSCLIHRYFVFAIE